MSYLSGHVMTLANSIIGVSVLAMPYCFKQCGIILSIILLLVSAAITRLSCHFLVKSAAIARTKTYELLAYHVFGSLGKLFVEIGIIGFLLGTCIAYFVVMGDLGPEIISGISQTKTTYAMRTTILIALAIFCILPLSLLRNVDSLNGISKATIGFYCCFVLKIIFEALPVLFKGDWINSVNLWRPAGILQCLPIFSMALACQTQIFETYEVLVNPTVEKMNIIIKEATTLCIGVYIFVGMFGYIAFFKEPFAGNILLTFSTSIVTDALKIGFIFSVVFSFPLVLFPCRASIYSLIYKGSMSFHEGSASSYMPENKFKGITVALILTSLTIGILVPSIELVLGFLGSTIGIMICVLFPVTCFICISPKYTNERIVAQNILFIGVMIMVMCTYANINAYQETKLNQVHLTEKPELSLLIPEIKTERAVALQNLINKVEIPEKKVANGKEIDNAKSIVKPAEDKKLEIKEPEIKEIRREPPQPIEPVENQPTMSENIQEPKQILNQDKKIENLDTNVIQGDQNAPALKQDSPKVEEKPKQENKPETGNRPMIQNNLETKEVEVDKDAIKKEDNELKAQELEKKNEAKEENQALIDTINQQKEIQQKIVEQQNLLLKVIQEQQANVKQHNDIDKVNEEKVKAVKKIESIAKEAIEKISANEEKADDKANPNPDKANPNPDKANPNHDKANPNHDTANLDHDKNELNNTLNQAKLEVAHNDLQPVLDAGVLPDNEQNRKKLDIKAEPLSYQLGLNIGKQIDRVETNKKNPLPIPLAMSSNAAIIKDILENNEKGKQNIPLREEVPKEPQRVEQNVPIRKNASLHNLPNKAQIETKQKSNPEQTKLSGTEKEIKKIQLKERENILRRKRDAIEVQNDDTKACDPTDVSLIRTVSKLSEPELVKVDTDKLNIGTLVPLKPQSRDLKVFSENSDKDEQ